METQNKGKLPIKIVHIITGLDTGGAEMMLFKLLFYSDGAAYQSTVISLTDIGPIGKKIQELGVPVYTVEMRGVFGFVGVFRTAKILRQRKPHIVQTWMYHADLIGGIIAKLILWRTPVIWGIRQSNLSDVSSKRRTIWIARIMAFFSHWVPQKIIVNSERGQRVHKEIGYSPNKMIVIPNGFDIERFQPDPAARVSVRNELGLSSETLLIGCIARFDPQKDHQTLIYAASQLRDSFLKEVHFVLCGRGIVWENTELISWIHKYQLQGIFHLLGERDDIPRITASLDVATLTSAYGEGFPNVIGEAMACQVPCVTTDSGDCRTIIGETGRIVPIRDAHALALAWKDTLSLPKEKLQRLGKEAREHILQNHDIRDIVSRFVGIYRYVGK